MSWIEREKRSAGRNGRGAGYGLYAVLRLPGSLAVGALLLLGTAVFAGMTAQASLGAHADVEVTEDGFDLNITGTAVLGYEGDGGDIVIPDGVKTIASGAFLGEEDITSVDLNEVMTVGHNAFAKSGLESVEAADEVKAIGGGAFAETKLTVFSVPPELLRLSADAFDGVETLKSFSGGSRNYPVYGGCVYADEGETLYIVPAAKTASVTVAQRTGVGNGGIEAADPIKRASAASETGLFADAAGDDENEGVDWVDADVLAAASGGRYAAVEHSLDTYDVNGDASDGTTDAASDTASDSQADDGSGTTEAADTETGAETETADDSVSDESTTEDTASDEAAADTAEEETEHNLDTTPKTADGDIDPKFIFCLALFLIGMAGLMFVRQRSAVQLAGRRTVVDSGELD